MIFVDSEQAMKAFGRQLGGLLRGGEVIELVGDVGAGKTTLVKGLAAGLGVDEAVQSPSFTINRTYTGRDGLVLSHYDFYRLHDPGIMADELREVADARDTVTVIEWADIVQDVLPADRLTIHITPSSQGEHVRQLDLHTAQPRLRRLLEQLQ